MALFHFHKKEKLTGVDLRGNANAIYQSLGGVRRLMEGRYEGQDALLRQLDTMASQYQNRLETSADVSALDQITLDTLAFLDTLLQDNLLTNPQQVAELFALAVQVLDKVYRIQSQCKAKPDGYLIDGLNAGCQAVRGKYAMLQRMQRYHQYETRLGQNEIAYETRLTALVRDGKKPGGDPELIQLVAEQHTLNNSMALLKQTISSESASIPVLINAFELADGLGISKEFIAAIEAANRMLVEMIAREQEDLQKIDDQLTNSHATQTVVSEMTDTQKTYGERMLEEKLAKDAQALSQHEKTALPQVENAPQYAPRQEEIL